MTIARILDIDKNDIQINKNKNVKHFSQDLINVTLKACQTIK